jgi:hypothetical protein
MSESHECMHHARRSMDPVRGSTTGGHSPRAAPNGAKASPAAAKGADSGGGPFQAVTISQQQQQQQGAGNGPAAPAPAVVAAAAAATPTSRAGQLPPIMVSLAGGFALHFCLKLIWNE